MPRSEHTTDSKTGAQHKTRKRSDAERRRAGSASATHKRRRGAEQNEASAPKSKRTPVKPAAAGAAQETKKAAPKRAPAKAAGTKKRRFERDLDAAADPAAVAAHAQPEDVTTDSLQLFFNAARKYPLLTAAEELELAKRIEKGDM